MPTWGVVAVALLVAWLQKVAKFAWEELKEPLFTAVVKVEETMQDADGPAKRLAVIGYMTNFVKAKVPNMPASQMWVLQLGITWTINGMIGVLNDTLGHDWLAAAKRWHEEVEAKIPWLDDGVDETK
jgi:hypothetical protein